MRHLDLLPSTRAIHFGIYKLALDRADLVLNPARSSNLKKARKATPPSDKTAAAVERRPKKTYCPTHRDTQALLECLTHRRRQPERSQYLEPVRFAEIAGVRSIELLNIRCENVHLEDKRIWIPVTKEGTDGLRFIPIARELAPLVGELGDRLAARHRDPVRRGRPTRIPAADRERRVEGDDARERGRRPAPQDQHPPPAPPVHVALDHGGRPAPDDPGARRALHVDEPLARLLARARERAHRAPCSALGGHLGFLQRGTQSLTLNPAREARN